MSLTESAFNFLCVKTGDDGAIYVNPYFLSVYSTLFKKLMETDSGRILQVLNIELRGRLNDWKMLMNDFVYYFEKFYGNDRDRETKLACLMVTSACPEKFNVPHDNYTDYLMFLNYLGLDRNFVEVIFADWFCNMVEDEIEIDYPELAKLPEIFHNMICFIALHIICRPNNIIEHYFEYKYYKVLKAVNPKKAAQLNDDLLMIRYEPDAFILKLKADPHYMSYNINFIKY